jgi:hypothetical protein
MHQVFLSRKTAEALQLDLPRVSFKPLKRWGASAICRSSLPIQVNIYLGVRHLLKGVVRFAISQSYIIPTGLG